MELLCLDSMNNARITLSGIGNIRIKNNCYAKYKGLLLPGSSHVLLNQSYQISLIHPVHFRHNLSLFRNTISNLSFPTLKEFSSSKDLEYLDTNPESTEVSTFLNIEFLISISISVFMSVFITIAIIIIFVKVTKYLSLRKKPKNDKILGNLPVTIEDKILSDILSDMDK